jgi:ubiquinone/menaquinone biosynthesis C-methylase UbiE
LTPPSEYVLKLSDAELTRYRLMAEGAARGERGWWTAAGVVPGAVVADVGCGPGAVSLVLARSVGPGGRVLAVDADPAVVAAAREAVVEAGVDNVTVQVGAADATGIPPESLDVVMIRHVLAHNGSREEAIVEHAATLVRPGGSVYLADVEADAIRTRPTDSDLEDLATRYHEWHRRRGNDLSVGLRLGELLRTAGLERVEHHGVYQIIAVPPGVRPPAWAAREALVEAGQATPDDLERWEAAFDRVDRADPPPTTFVPLFVAYGYRAAS